MKNIRIFCISLLCILTLALPVVRASELEDKENQIKELEKKITELQTQAKTLADQVTYYDVQIALNTLKISQTEDMIASLSGKINILETRLLQRSLILEKQIVHTYKQGSLDPLQIMLSSTNFSLLLSRLKYAQTVQANNRRILHDTQVIQLNYARQKTLVEDAQKKLEVQKKTLAGLREEKDNLLLQTKNSEAVYEKQLESARLELAAIQTALATGIREGPVKAGDPIALVGNTGYPSCSTGKHLHFEVRLNDTWVNAELYLKKISDKWGLNIGSGNWNWPISGDIEITQRYGKTPYSYRYIYSGGTHTGIDMVSNQDVIKAVADGILYSSTQKCGSSDLKIKYIDHGSGLKTFFLHVQ
ncbi:MAG: Cell Wall Hydrolase [Candidatus Amesbacteria bacterium GW2011_GWB1_47_19]|nr:MAG: Cell Wall Hydrolase [Candidatus Amesbacteria bacterium GW2011_GWA1_44_24]KKU31360.1 MAG: Cell Wall Hydrolase [Candidatus Amesbacteria bacterium GW2011_GWC1_46_24]KKU66987.1 MAG: Cell Wall Hydrolase [Candidatus Amesbacteria bacterium GW2011_GWB1_47_19]OGD04852.1 MAG: hypothetical protein A2379_04785 [Candidatus Amesbacteria bacterium RIFOXYB1_FULL_47_13]